MKFVPVSLQPVRVAVFSDASFASNRDHYSQAGFVVVLIDQDGNANVSHYFSFLSRRIAKSALAAKPLAVVHAFDYANTISTTINELFGCLVLLALYKKSLKVAV